MNISLAVVVYAGNLSTEEAEVGSCIDLVSKQTKNSYTLLYKYQYVCYECCLSPAGRVV